MYVAHLKFLREVLLLCWWWYWQNNSHPHLEHWKTSTYICSLRGWWCWQRAAALDESYTLLFKGGGECGDIGRRHARMLMVLVVTFAHFKGGDRQICKVTPLMSSATCKGTLCAAFRKLPFHSRKSSLLNKLAVRLPTSSSLFPAAVPLPQVLLTERTCGRSLSVFRRLRKL